MLVCSEEAAGSTEITAVHSAGLAGYNPVSNFYFPPSISLCCNILIRSKLQGCLAGVSMVLRQTFQQYAGLRAGLQTRVW